MPNRYTTSVQTNHNSHQTLHTIIEQGLKITPLCTALLVNPVEFLRSRFKIKVVHLELIKRLTAHHTPPKCTFWHSPLLLDIILYVHVRLPGDVGVSSRYYIYVCTYNFRCWRILTSYESRLWALSVMVYESEGWRRLTVDYKPYQTRPDHHERASVTQINVWRVLFVVDQA